jgi:hypothetical protein
MEDGAGSELAVVAAFHGEPANPRDNREAMVSSAVDPTHPRLRDVRRLLLKRRASGRNQARDDCTISSWQAPTTDFTNRPIGRAPMALQWLPTSLTLRVQAQPVVHAIAVSEGNVDP